MTDLVASIGYALAGISFLVLGGLLLTRWRGRVHGIMLPVAAIVSAGWALYLARAVAGTNIYLTQVFVAEIMFHGVWILLLSQILVAAAGSSWQRFVRYSGLLLVIAVLLISLDYQYTGWFNQPISGSGSIMVRGSLLTALVGLIGIEQIYRNARPSQRNALKYLCVGLTAIFAYNLILYSNAIIVGQISSALWSARGFIVAMSVPLIAMAAYRSPSWKRGIFVSRQIVFYATTLIGAGVYLMAMGIAGYYIGVIGGSWEPVVRLVFFGAAIIVFFVLILSDQIRANVRVFLSKNFLQKKYEYRDEWLRLIDTLTDLQDDLPLKKRAIKALAQIVDSDAGVLWLRHEGDASYECVSGWNRPELNIELPYSHALVAFLSQTGWVVDISDFIREPDGYKNLTLNSDELSLFDSGIIVPLKHEQDLFGFVMLARPRTAFTLDFEDHDLLKTVGQQIASYLAQEQSTERLAESRQFEAFNKLTAFIMHDLKNALAQQSLVVENAERHKRNPDFIDDAIDTIKGSVVRLSRVIEHLQQRNPDCVTQRVELRELVSRVVAQCEDRKPLPKASLSDLEIWVIADQDRLSTAIQHAIRNAQDATPDDGDVQVTIESNDGVCSIVVADTGEGMDERFVRERLFRPFDSTKGTQGMGIGAYQIKETIRASGGDVTIESAPGVGTKIRLSMPVCQGVRVS